MNGSIKFSTWLWLLGAENGVEHIFKSSQKKKEDRVESEKKKKKTRYQRESHHCCEGSLHSSCGQSQKQGLCGHSGCQSRGECQC